MPKEMIYGKSLPYGEEDPGRAVVEIRWGREGYFQIATKCVHAADETDYRPPLEPIEVPMRPPHEGEYADPQPLLVSENEGFLEVAPFSGFYVDLDRRGINELIRVLRRARDAAYGKDE